MQLGCDMQSNRTWGLLPSCGIFFGKHMISQWILECYISRHTQIWLRHAPTLPFSPQKSGGKCMFHRETVRKDMKHLMTYVTFLTNSLPHLVITVENGWEPMGTTGFDSTPRIGCISRFGSMTGSR